MADDAQQPSFLPPSDLYGVRTVFFPATRTPTYTPCSIKDYKLTRVVRVFSTVGTPVMLQAAYACPADAYSSSEMETLFKATPISNPGPADMDEAGPDNGSGKDSKSNNKKKSDSGDKKSDEKGSGSSPKDT